MDTEILASGVLVSGSALGAGVFLVGLKYRRLAPKPLTEEKHPRPSGFRIPRGLLAVAVFLLGYQSLFADSSSEDEKFLAGLRQRRLFELAEKYCQTRLADQALPAADRAAYTLEWLRTLSEHAAHSAPNQRPPIWDTAEQIALSFLRDNPTHPQHWLIKTQQALAVVAQGDLALLESEVAADPQAALVRGRETIRRATRLLSELAAELASVIPLRRRDSVSPEELTADELTSLLNNIRFQLARAERQLGISYPEGSPDRLAALTQAVEQLAVVMRELPADEPLGLKIRLEELICQRLLGDEVAVREAWSLLDKETVPPEMRLAARAEQVRWHLSKTMPQEALKVLALGRTIHGVASAEWDFAHLETYASLWMAAVDAKQAAESEKWRDQAIQTVNFIEQTYGTYWGRRAEILLVRAGGKRSDGSVEILRRAADDFFLKGQIDEAIATYDKAALAARAAQDAQAAFTLAYKAALVEQQRTRHVDAARRFRELALSQQNHPQAANAHLLAVMNEAQVWKAVPARKDQYVALLEEHSNHWPYSATVNAVKLWLGGVYEHEQSWQSAVATYRAINRESEQFQEAIRGAERCWAVWLPQRKAAGENPEPIAEEAAKWLQASFLGPGQMLPQSWNAPQRLAMLAAVRLRLQWAHGSLSEMELWLKAAIQSPEETTPDWTADASTLLVAVLARQGGRAKDACEVLQQIPVTSVDRWLGLARQLSGYHSVPPGEAQTQLAELQLVALQRMREVPGILSADLQKEMTRLRGAALFAAGKQREAIEVFTEFAKQNSANAEIQVEYGDMLLASQDRADWQRGLDQWRLIASRTQPRTARWFQAKYAIAQAHYQLGDKHQAEKLIRYLQATENMSKSGLEKEFAELLRRVESKESRD